MIKSQFTVLETASLLGVSPKTVSQWIRDEKLKAIKCGREYRIGRSDICEYLNIEGFIIRNGKLSETKTGESSKSVISATVQLTLEDEKIDDFKSKVLERLEGLRDEAKAMMEKYQQEIDDVISMLNQEV